MLITILNKKFTSGCWDQRAWAWIQAQCLSWFSPHVCSSHTYCYCQPPGSATSNVIKPCFLLKDTVRSEGRKPLVTITVVTSSEQLARGLILITLGASLWQPAPPLGQGKFPFLRTDAPSNVISISEQELILRAVSNAPWCVHCLLLTVRWNWGKL
jgi:hypothetical protein